MVVTGPMRAGWCGRLVRFRLWSAGWGMSWSVRIRESPWLVLCRHRIWAARAGWHFPWPEGQVHGINGRKPQDGQEIVNGPAWPYRGGAGGCLAGIGYHGPAGEHARCRAEPVVAHAERCFRRRQGRAGEGRRDGGGQPGQGRWLSGQPGREDPAAFQPAEDGKGSEADGQTEGLRGTADQHEPGGRSGRGRGQTAAAQRHQGHVGE